MVIEVGLSSGMKKDANAWIASNGDDDAKFSWRNGAIEQGGMGFESNGKRLSQRGQSHSESDNYALVLHKDGVPS